MSLSYSVSFPVATEIKSELLSTTHKIIHDLACAHLSGSASRFLHHPLPYVHSMAQPNRMTHTFPTMLCSVMSQGNCSEGSLFLEHPLHLLLLAKYHWFFKKLLWSAWPRLSGPLVASTAPQAWTSVTAHYTEFWSPTSLSAWDSGLFNTIPAPSPWSDRWVVRITACNKRSPKTSQNVFIDAPCLLETWAIGVVGVHGH